MMQSASRGRPIDFAKSTADFRLIVCSRPLCLVPPIRYRRCAAAAPLGGAITYMGAVFGFPRETLKALPFFCSWRKMIDVLHHRGPDDAIGGCCARLLSGSSSSVNNCVLSSRAARPNKAPIVRQMLNLTDFDWFW